MGRLRAMPVLTVEFDTTLHRPCTQLYSWKRWQGSAFFYSFMIYMATFGVGAQSLVRQDVVGDLAYALFRGVFSYRRSTFFPGGFFAVLTIFIHWHLRSPFLRWEPCIWFL